jgi:hypothetical protein
VPLKALCEPMSAKNLVPLRSTSYMLLLTHPVASHSEIVFDRKLEIVTNRLSPLPMRVSAPRALSCPQEGKYSEQVIIAVTL